MTQDKVVVIMGSSKDQTFTKPILLTLKKLGLPYELRISSAHKTPHQLLEMLDEYDLLEDRIVYITVAGRSNALSGIVDANTCYPVIACPPKSELYGGADIFSSLRSPSGVSPLVVLEPENAALAAAKILALSNSKIRKKVSSYQQEIKKKIEIDDSELRKE